MENQAALLADFTQRHRQATATGRKVRFSYFDAYHALHESTSPIREILEDSAGAVLVLASGERVLLRNVIEYDGHFFPGYEAYQAALAARCSR